MILDWPNCVLDFDRLEDMFAQLSEIQEFKTEQYLPGTITNAIELYENNLKNDIRKMLRYACQEDFLGKLPKDLSNYIERCKHLIA